MRPLATAALLATLLTAETTQVAVAATAQNRPASPSGRSAIEVGGTHDPRYGYEGGQWIEIRYGRPIRRGRDIFGPSDWKEALNDGAEVWRAGANYSTVLTTEIPLEVDGTRVEPGDYTIFIELQDGSWTFIVSRWPAQTTYDYENKEALFGAYYYTPDRDIVRTPMVIQEIDVSFEQLSWQFADLTDQGVQLVLLWGNRKASVTLKLD